MKHFLFFDLRLSGINYLIKHKIGKTLALAIVLIFMLLGNNYAQSGTVTFTGNDGDNIGLILHDGTHSNDISGIQLDIFCAMTASDATSRTNTGSFTLWDPSWGFTYDQILPIDVTSGNSYVNENNLPTVMVIMSNDGSEFSFKSIYIADFFYGNQTTSKFEGFKNGISKGSVNLSVNTTTYEETFTTSDFPTAIFGDVDEVRISNVTMSRIYGGFNNITIGSPIISAPTTQASSITFSSVGTTQMTIGWTNGNGASRAIFVKQGTGTITNPSDNTTYTASSNWSSKGTQLGTSGYYCVYNGTGTNVTLTGLTASTQYTMQAFEYNGSAGSEAYNTATATNNPNNQTTLTIPTVSSVSVPSNNTYISSENLDFTVNFSEAVTVVTSGGTPYIPITMNTGGTVNAGYISGSGTSALVFRYTVVSGNADNNGVAIGASISSNGGTIRSGSGIDANLTLNSVGSTTGVLVDAIAPTISSVGVPSNATYIAGQNLDFMVNFDEPITVVTTGGTPYIPITLNTGGTVNATYQSGSGTSALVFRYTVVSGNADNNGIAVGSTITANGGTLKDAAGNNATFTLNSVGSTTGVLVDAIAPTVTLSSTASSPTTVTPIPVTVTFSEPVTGFSIDDIIVSNGTKGNFTGTGTTYALDITPLAQGTVTIDVSGSVAQDPAGNANLAATQLSLNYQIVTGIKPLTSQFNQILVSPAIVREIVKIDIVHPQNGNVDVRVINFNGIVIKHLRFSKTNNNFSAYIDLSDVPIGNYLIEFNMDGFREIKRIIIQQ